jgi:hypothetical protein
MKRWPIIPTIIVIIAVGIMIGLGVWQLQRKAEKEALLARYNAADGLPAVTWPDVTDPKALPLFRRSTLMCGKVLKIESVSGSMLPRAKQAALKALARKLPSVGRNARNHPAGTADWSVAS